MVNSSANTSTPELLLLCFHLLCAKYFTMDVIQGICFSNCWAVLYTHRLCHFAFWGKCSSFVIIPEMSASELHVRVTVHVHYFACQRKCSPNVKTQMTPALVYKQCCRALKLKVKSLPGETSVDMTQFTDKVCVRNLSNETCGSCVWKQPIRLKQQLVVLL